MLAVCLVACSPSEGSTPIQAATADIPVVPPSVSGAPVASATPSSVPTTAPLRFVWTGFHFEFGTTLMEVDGREVTEVFTEHRPAIDGTERYTEVFHHRARYRLTGTEASRLRGSLASDAFWALDARYINHTIDDGTTQTFTVTLGSRSKEVYCYHQWPEPVLKLRRTIRDIQKAHAAERRVAPEIDDEQAAAAVKRAEAAAKAAGRTD